MPLIEITLNPAKDSLVVDWRMGHPPAEVWDYLNREANLPEWLGHPVHFDARIGGEIVIDHGDGLRCRSEVVSIDPGNSAELTWEFPDEPASNVSVRTAGANLTLSHRGLGSLAESYAVGWTTHLSFLEASLNGTPLPSEAFWLLNATFTTLITQAGRTDL